MWDSSGCDNTFSGYWRAYKGNNPESELYLFDLAGYGTTGVSVLDNDVYLVSGWSDKIFNMLAALKEGGGAVDKIKKIVL